MKTLASLEALAAWRDETSSLGELGFVPTMGALHAGHLSLVRRSVAENSRTLVSIFVNPAQFERADDLAAYPRDLEADRSSLAAAGCDALFVPTPEQFYPPGYQTWVEVADLARPLEGSARPGHFRGVATVVLKLLLLAGAQRAYFGRKDAQQLAVVRRLVADLHLPVAIVACPTVREPDGLAMSSRNARLAPQHRRAAAGLYAALRAAEGWWKDGERDGPSLRRKARQALETAVGERLLDSGEAIVDYVSVAQPATFREAEALDPATPPLVSVAVRFGEVRLIDNLSLPALQGPRD